MSASSVTLSRLPSLASIDALYVGRGSALAAEKLWLLTAENSVFPSATIIGTEGNNALISVIVLSKDAVL